MVLYCGLKLQRVHCLCGGKKVILDHIGHRKFIKYRIFKEKLKELLRAYFYGLHFSTAKKKEKHVTPEI